MGKSQSMRLKRLASREISRKQQWLSRYMRDHQIPNPGAKVAVRIASILAETGLVPPANSTRAETVRWIFEKLNPSGVIHKRRDACVVRDRGAAKPTINVDLRVRTVEEGRAFYETPEWRRIRMDILVRDGRRCACCGATPDDGVKINVDHIKPLRFNWHLRLERSNLQVLCAPCNEGKGNRIEADFRPARAA